MPEIVNGPSQGAFDNYKKFINSNSNKKSKTRLIGFFAVIVLLVSLPVIIIVSRQRTVVRQRASGTGFDVTQYTSCGTAPADIMLIIDRSGSMANTLGNSKITKMAAAQTAANNFVDIVSTNTQNHVGLTDFQTTSTLDNKLTTNYSSVKTSISSLSPGSNTCTQCGAKTADDEIHADGRSGFKKVVILLTDGIANTVIGNPNKVPAAEAESNALQEVQNGFNADGDIYFTIGLGNRNGTGDTGINEKFLQNIAAATGGQYFYSPSTDDLNQIYQDIANIIGKGSVIGTVFNDQNANGKLDSGEPPLEGWTVNLNDASNANTIASTTSASDGSYIFTGICDQSYAVSQTVQSGWTQTSPPSPGYYSVTITNGSTAKNKDFGNTQAVPSPTACITPAPIKNVQIMCVNCSGSAGQ